MKKIYKYILLFFYLLILSSNLTAQQNTISLQPGLFFSLYKDEVSSPLPYWVASFGVNMGYQLESDDNIHKVELSITMGEARNSISDTTYLYRYTDQDTGELVENNYKRTTEYINGELGYSYNRKAYESSDSSLYPGLQFKFTFNMQLSDYPTMNSCISLGPSILQKIHFSDKDEIRMSVGIPLLSYVVRPPFAGADDELLGMAYTNPLLIYKTGEFATVNQFFSINLDVEYRHRFLPWLEGAVEFQNCYTYIADPRPKKEFIFNALPSVNFKY